MRGQPARDDHAICEGVCPHNLAAGVLVTDLLDRDGPHRPRKVRTPLGPAWVMSGQLPTEGNVAA